MVNAAGDATDRSATDRPATDGSANDWSFARRPKWLFGHALALVLIATFVAAGLWQWSRHREVSSRNDRIEARQELPPVDAAELGTADPDALEFRTAVLTGIWDPAGTVTIRNRSLGGAPGCHVVTPLVLDGGDAVLVNRGFANLPDCDGAEQAFEPTGGEHQVSGLVRKSQRRGAFGARDPDEGVLSSLSRLDVDRIAQQYERPLAAVYLELAPESAAAETAPFPLPPPELSDGPHLSYTVQWFLFATVGLIGYPLVLWRQSRGGRSNTPPPPDAAVTTPSEPAVTPLGEPTPSAPPRS
jgi:cytochrome oxidase assembly protein ShyY1